VNARPYHAAVVLVVLALAALLGTCLPVVAVAAEVPTVKLVAAPAAVVNGDLTKLTARVSVPQTTLTLSRQYAGASGFTTLDTAIADASGKVVWSRRPTANATYRVTVAGEAAVVPADVSVGVRPRIALRVVSREPIITGRRVTLSISVRPSHPGAAVQLQRRSDGGWVLMKELVLGEASTARFSWRADTLGALAVRATMVADTDHLAGGSPVWKSAVYDRDNPYGVPTRYPHLILVDLSQYRLYYHEHGQVVRVFDCVLGRPGLPTPRGHYRIYAKDPSMGVPYGPRRMRYLGAYAIHGTNEPWLLNRYPRSYSHGCTRLANANILWLYPRVPVGTPVWNVP